MNLKKLLNKLNFYRLQKISRKIISFITFTYMYINIKKKIIECHFDKYLRIIEIIILFSSFPLL